ncbi:MAG TPA: thiamine biosynthesis protein ThiS [Peptococcaceae bacterium]|nr:thiamine biosynthesis protein ThiS [Peptococcaceae bacterium]
MKVVIPIPERRVHEIKGPKQVHAILKELGLVSESVIVIWGENLLTPDVTVPDEAEIEVRPAISGG